MGRKRYDVWLKPIPDTNMYQIRFTNEEAIRLFTEAAVRRGIYKPNYVCHHLNEWKPIVNEMVNYVTFTTDFNHMSTKKDYICYDHWAHGIKINQYEKTL